MLCRSRYRLQSAQNGGAALKTLSCLMLAALLAGCLPIGIRGTNLPIYGDVRGNPSAGAPLAPRTA
jgi:hypothetical protein